MRPLKINIEAIERDTSSSEAFCADGVRIGSLLVSSHGVRDTSGTSFVLSLNDLAVVPESEGGFLGKGSSGSVRRAIDRRTGRVVAVKEIKATGQAHINEIRRELETLHSSEYPTQCLVTFYGAFAHEGSVFIAMEALDGSLRELPKPIPLRVLAHIVRRMLRGLVYLHRTRHLIHRDLKPSNVLFSRETGAIKISDFGVSSNLECTKGDAHSFVGTVTYMSPERLRGDNYSYSADVWSLGLVVAELAIGVCPFAGLRGGSSEARFWALLQHLNSSSPALDLPASMDEDLADFIHSCVVKQPADRPSCTQLLQHRFFERFISRESQPNDSEEAEEDAADRVVIRQWLREVTMAPQSGVETSAGVELSNPNIMSTSPTSGVEVKGSEAVVSSASYLGSCTEVPLLEHRSVVPNDGDGVSPPYMSPTEPNAAQHVVASDEPSVNLDDELNKLLIQP